MLAIFEGLFFIFDLFLSFPLYLLFGLSMLISIPLWGSENAVLNVLGVVIPASGFILGLFCQFKWIDALAKMKWGRKK